MDHIDGDRHFIRSSPGVRAEYQWEEADFSYVSDFDHVHTSVYSELEDDLPRVVEQSHLPAKRTLDQLGIARRTFYRWYDLHLADGPEALQDRPSGPTRVWNRIAPEVQDQIVEMALQQANRSCDQAIIVFDRSSIAPALLKVIGNIAFRPQYGFVVVVDSLRGDYHNLGLAYLLARDMASADKQIEIETDLLLILMDRIVSEANRLLEIRSLVEDGIKKSQDVISRLEQGSLSMDFCRSYLKKFLETGTLSKADLLEFYSGKDLKIKYQAIHDEIVALGQ